tara:strand:- start:40 stop:669 length:630 start_codon:yes stop_codon:yes gene_type:complete
MQNQIEILKQFIKSEEKINLFINEINDELKILYIGIIKYYSKANGTKVSLNEKSDVDQLFGDLFPNKELRVFTEKNSKKLSSIIKLNEKKVIFTDYKNYKNLSSKYNNINSYRFEKDIKFFIKNELNIDNDELLYHCISNPSLLFSEISKYSINNNRYARDQLIVEEKNHILDIRRSIFETKKNNFNIKTLYHYIKKEAEYKKLNFLAY